MAKRRRHHRVAKCGRKANGQFRKCGAGRRKRR